MTIKFKYTSNNILIENLDINNLNNVLDIKKEMCKNKENIDPSIIKLIFLGKILKDNEKIKDCGLNDNVTVHVIIKEKENIKKKENCNTYDEEKENKINTLINLNIINNRDYIINLLNDNNWDQNLVASILIAYIE